MAARAPQSAPAPAVAGLHMQALLTGELIELRQGRPVVRYPSGPQGGVLARLLGHLWGAGLPTPSLPAAALLFLENGDPLKPIVIGLVQDQVPDRQTLVLDMERIVLQGHTEVQLRCGQASVTMRADGKVVVKGSELLSKASATNKIRGASVQIN